jgi:thioredoxin-dependent peroxiredoxin
MSVDVSEGGVAPDFTLPAQDGRQVSLHDYRGRKDVVLYFYPKDFTSGCTTEAKTFSSSYGEFAGMGAEVIGISSDTEETHKKFGEKCEVSFPLLSDRGSKVRSLYGVKPSFGIIPGRVTFVIDKEGVVRKIFSSQLEPQKHVSVARETLKSLHGQS